MHAKVTVADDVVFTGSFNLSRRGEKNAENMLEIHDAALAERLAAFVDQVRARYPRFKHRGNPGFPREPLAQHLITHCSFGGCARAKPGSARRGSRIEVARPKAA